MTERNRSSVLASRNDLVIGPSAMSWNGDALVISMAEVAVPVPFQVTGTVTVHPSSIGEQSFKLDGQGTHHWRPISPKCRIDVQFSRPDVRWSGSGYLDTNWGSEPLQSAFASWNWSRASLTDRSAILYDVIRRREPPLSLALEIDRHGDITTFQPPQRVDLPRTLWGIERSTAADGGAAKVARRFEDGPFYSRSLLATTLLGERARAVHESLDLDRFSTRWVKLLLPFRMPRELRRRST